MTIRDEVNANIIGHNLTEWLMKTYECINVPAGQMPPSPDQYDVPEGKCIFLARNQISLFSPTFIISREKQQYSYIAEKIDEYFEDFKSHIVNELKKDGINKGDELYISDYPIVLVDEKLFRQRKFGLYGWLDVYSKRVELKYD